MYVCINIDIFIYINIYYISNVIHNEFIPSGRSFMYIKIKSGPSTDPCVTPDIVFLHSDV